jgi:hypothetical protein
MPEQLIPSQPSFSQPISHCSIFGAGQPRLSVLARAWKATQRGVVENGFSTSATAEQQQQNSNSRTATAEKRRDPKRAQCVVAS